MTPPNIICGSAAWTFDEYTENADKVPGVLRELGIQELDTAPIYPVKEPQKCEKMIGEWGFASSPLRLRIDSKILYFGNGDGTLAPEAIAKSLDQSLSNIKYEKLHILYCHGPDRATPLSEQAAALDAEYRKGKFEKLGISNWPVDMLQKFLQIVDEKGYIKPSVYQGQYNLLCRTYEDELIPLLRKHKLTFTAFSPLAGGFLSGKLTFAKDDAELNGTRFEANETNYMGMAYRHWYDKPSMHAAVRQMRDICKPHDIEVDDAASRWLLYHSALDGGPILNRDKGDSVIIGPRTFEQLVWSSESYIRGPLPKELVDGLNRLWEGVKEDAAAIIVY